MNKINACASIFAINVLEFNKYNTIEAIEADIRNYNIALDML